MKERRVLGIKGPDLVGYTPSFCKSIPYEIYNYIQNVFLFEFFTQ